VAVVVVVVVATLFMLWPSHDNQRDVVCAAAVAKMKLSRITMPRRLTPSLVFY